jgi:hypothetical protein
MRVSALSVARCVERVRLRIFRTPDANPLARTRADVVRESCGATTDFAPSRYALKCRHHHDRVQTRRSSDRVFRKGRHGAA